MLLRDRAQRVLSSPRPLAPPVISSEARNLSFLSPSSLAVISTEGRNLSSPRFPYLATHHHAVIYVFCIPNASTGPTVGRNRCPFARVVGGRRISLSSRRPPRPSFRPKREISLRFSSLRIPPTPSANRANPGAASPVFDPASPLPCRTPRIAKKDRREKFHPCQPRKDEPSGFFQPIKAGPPANPKHHRAVFLSNSSRIFGVIQITFAPNPWIVSIE